MTVEVVHLYNQRMSAPIISTKLYMPKSRSALIRRPRLIERLNEGRTRKLTLVSASAGFGKTTLVSEWLSELCLPAAWLSLDEGDRDPSRFLIYLAAALQKAGVPVGEGMFAILQSPQPPPLEALLTILINGINDFAKPINLVLDDYHIAKSEPIDQIIGFLLDHLPVHLHLVIITREDPSLPLSRMRVQNQLNELRALDLRFTASETTDFFKLIIGVSLSRENIELLESRTEGWIAGLQLAGISMQGRQDAEAFIRTFTGSHHYLMDFLVEEVLHKQPEHVQTFLLQTSVLERLCGSLCDAVTDSDGGQERLTWLERSNLFVVPLDDERGWYRYHHLFGEALRQRLHEQGASADLHKKASRWYADNGYELEALYHATAAGDEDRAARLIEGDGMPLHFRGAVGPVLNWLEAQPRTVLDRRPALWVIYASVLLMAGRISAVPDKLHAAEAALQQADANRKTNDLHGHLASIRASLAVVYNETETILKESHRALELLDPNNLPVRTATSWTLGYACQMQGNRLAAMRAYEEAIAASETIGHLIILIMSSLGIGSIHEYEGRLSLAADIYNRVIRLAGDPPLVVVCEAYLGLGRIDYERDHLESAEQHGKQAVQLAKQLDAADRVVASEVFLAKLMLARGDRSGGSALLIHAEHTARQRQFTKELAHIQVIRTLMMLNKADLSVYAELKSLQTEGRVQAALLEAIAQYERGDKRAAFKLIGETMVLAESEGHIRSFIALGIPMCRLLEEAHTRGMMPAYTAKLLERFPPAQRVRAAKRAPSLIEPLSQRELEVLRLVAQGLSNEEIAQRLHLALSTVKGHNRTIFDKLQVQRRTEAVALARKRGLIEPD